MRRARPSGSRSSPASAFDYDQFASLAKAAARAGIIFISTAFDVDSVTALEPLVPAYKIASGDNDCFPLLERVAQTGKPVLLSTGMLDLDGVAARQGGDRCQYGGKARSIPASSSCTASPPIRRRRRRRISARCARLHGLGCRVGYSDHTLGNEAAVLAVALGARVIEKHFTLDKNLSEFRDHKLSADPGEFADLVHRIRAAEEMLGTGVKRVMPAEEPSLLAARRAIMAARDLSPGTVIDKADLTWLRPRRGLAPGRETELVGRTLATTVRRGEPILPEHLS